MEAGSIAIKVLQCIGLLNYGCSIELSIELSTYNLSYCCVPRLCYFIGKLLIIFTDILHVISGELLIIPWIPGVLNIESMASHGIMEQVQPHNVYTEPAR